MQTKLSKRISKEVKKIPLVDTHEHFLLEEERLNTKLDLFYLFPDYASSDLISSGMPFETLDEIRLSEHSLKEKWGKFKPYWERIKNTSEKIATKIPIDMFSDSGGLRGEQHDLTRKPKQ